jgi:hypothetical protein
VNPDITQWAIRNGVTAQALAELRGIFGLSQSFDATGVAGESEAAVQARVRLEAVRKHMRLWRNNVGALLDSRGVPVRYGLANDTPALNRTVKSGDLIGWRPVLIAPEHVGSTIECKRVGWRYTGDDHELAQQKWNELVNAAGGDACFVTGEGSL